MVQELVDSVEADFDCTLSLEYLIVGVEPYFSQFTVVVRPAGRKCKAALRALHLRGTAFPVKFIALDPHVVAPVQSPVPKSNGEGSGTKEEPKNAN